MILRSELVRELPRLGWVGLLEPARDRAVVLHGALVESGPEWVVEGAWDGPYEDGAFDEAESFFGSGLRVRGSSIVLVASTSLTDRLLYCELPEGILVSNSQVLLLAGIGGRLRVGHDYAPECHASLEGIWRYPREIPIEHEKVSGIRQLIHGNLRVDASGCRETVRSRRRRIGSYSEYLALLGESLGRLRDNSIAGGRRAPLVGATTLSTGYDSAAVSSLVRPLGVQHCFTTRPAEWKNARTLEDGRALAAALGYEPRFLTPPSDAPEAGRYEPYFIAGTFDGSESVFASLAAFVSTLDGGVLLWTGYHGDKVWDVNLPAEYQRDDILRGDTSGVNLTEARLEMGFINAAVPFMYARSVAELVKIGLSDEMKPWRLDNDYDRPIPRRIVESAGVDRQLFGWGKKAVMRYHNLPEDPGLREEFLSFVEERTALGRWHAPAQDWLAKADYAIDRLRASLPVGRRAPLWTSGLKRRFIPAEEDLRQLMYKWAVERLSSRYRAALRQTLPPISC